MVPGREVKPWHTNEKHATYFTLKPTSVTGGKANPNIPPMQKQKQTSKNTAFMQIITAVFAGLRNGGNGYEYQIYSSLSMG